MKIIHTSDWHLGARLHEEERSEEHQAFLDWLLAKIDEIKPDALVVTGDVFDIKAPSPSVQEMYYKFLAEVARRGACRKVVVTAGNHDNAHLLAAPSTVLEGIGVSVIAVAQDEEACEREVVIVPDASGQPGLVIGAVPFIYPAELSNFGAADMDESVERSAKIARGWDKHYTDVLAKAAARAPEAPLVLTGHCMLAETAVSDEESERGRTVGGLEAFDPAPLAGADYVALGHLHRPQAVKGYEEKMFYSGSPLAMSFDEAKEEKYINVVTLNKKGEKPVVEKCAVPRNVPILTLQGEPKKVEVELSRLVAEDGMLRRFVRVRLEGFEGSADLYWNLIREIVKNSRTLILTEEDLRPTIRATAGLGAFKGKSITQIKPREMAEQKLKSSSQHFSEEEIKIFMEMFDEVTGGVQ